MYTVPQRYLQDDVKQIVKDVNWAFRILKNRGLNSKKGKVAAMVLNAYLNNENEFELNQGFTVFPDTPRPRKRRKMGG